MYYATPASSIYRKSNWIVLLTVLFTTFIPSFGSWATYKLIIIFILWCVQSTSLPNDENVIYYRRRGRFIILLWFFSILFAAATVMLVEDNLNYSVIIHEFSRIAYYLFLIDLCFKIKISLRILFNACSIIIAIHCAIQISQYLSLGIVDDLIINYYLNGDEANGHYLMSLNEGFGGFRSGSIFANPNVYVCYPYLSLGVFLQYYRQTKGNMPFSMIIVAFISVVLTGSRMGMGSFLFLLGWYTWYSSRHSSRYFSGHISHKGMVIIVAALFFGILYFDALIDSLKDMRAFSFDEAYEGSGSIKMGGFLGYLKISYPLEWIFGSLGAPRLKIAIDAEWGYIFAWFGIIGMFWYLKLIKLVYDYHKNDFRIISSIATFSIILTALGASSVLNMSVFPYICAIGFTNIYKSSKIVP